MFPQARSAGRLIRVVDSQRAVATAGNGATGATAGVQQPAVVLHEQLRWA